MTNKDLLLLSIFTFLTVLAWIVFDAYHAAVTTTVTPTEKKLMEPLTPTFDRQIILKLKERQSP